MKVGQTGEGGGNAVCRGSRPREEVQPDPVPGDGRTEGGGSVGVSSTMRICGCRPVCASGRQVCQPCILCRGRADAPPGPPRNNKALLEGRAGPKFVGGQNLPQGGTSAGGEGEVPAGVDKNMDRVAARLNRPTNMSAMRQAHGGLRRPQSQPLRLKNR